MKLLVNGSRSFRVDLEGIRGLALIIILLTHLIEWPTGGFVALDLFFVLSGYLITGLLIREHERTGRIDVSAFYRRRIRRLGPAATLVIVITVVAGFILFPLARAQSIWWDGVWAMLLVSNWNFALNGTDYFATWKPQSPILHFWSLSVEEQFYLVWPAIIIAGIAIGAAALRRRHRHGSGGSRYAWVIALIALITAASFAWGVIQPLGNPQVSYLSTLTRAWEIGFGALLFFGNALWKKVPSALRPVLAWGGVVVLLVSAGVLTPDTPYPSFWALLPVLATTGIILAGVGGDGKLVLATNPVARYLGQISYSAYLWHWPIFIYIAALVGKQSPVYLWGAIPLSLVVAALSFHFVEDPIRHSSWLEPRSHHSRRSAYSESRRRRRAILTKVGAVAAFGVALMLVAFAVISPRSGGPSEASTPRPSSSASATSSAGGEDAISLIDKQVLEALDTPQWPDAVRAAIESGEATGPNILSNSCLDVSAETEDSCIVGDESLPRTAVVVGDSVAVSWMPGLGAALNDLGYRVRMLTHSQCPFADVSVSGAFEAGARRAGYPEACNDHRSWARDRIQQIKPDLVVAADGEVEMQTLILPDGKDAKQYWTEGMVSASNGLGAIPLVVLTSPPQSASISDCYTRVSTVKDCTDRVTTQWREQTAATDKANGTVAQRFGMIDVRGWYCSPDGWCPPFVDNIVVRADRQHVAEPYARRLQPVLVEALRDTIASLPGVVAP